MKLARTAVIAVSSVLLCVGYFVSQMRYLEGSTAQYVQSLDSSPIPLISLFLLVAAIVIGVMRDPDEEGEPE